MEDLRSSRSPAQPYQCKDRCIRIRRMPVLCHLGSKNKGPVYQRCTNHSQSLYLLSYCQPVSHHNLFTDAYLLNFIGYVWSENIAYISFCLAPWVRECYGSLGLISRFLICHLNLSHSIPNLHTFYTKIGRYRILSLTCAMLPHNLVFPIFYMVSADYEPYYYIKRVVLPKGRGETLYRKTGL